MSESIYSDRALAKQAHVREHGVTSWSDLVGIEEPRTQPRDDERCHQCGLDARPTYGGDFHFCELHIGRDYEIGDDCPTDCRRVVL